MRTELKNGNSGFSLFCPLSHHLEGSAKNSLQSRSLVAVPGIWVDGLRDQEGEMAMD